MDLIVSLLAVLAIALYTLRTREQKQRIVLLARHLGRYQIERQMESLMDGYLRWLGEDLPERRSSIRAMLDGTEQSLVAQFRDFADQIRSLPAPLAQVSKLPVWTPWAQQLLPRWRLFDVREAFALHAQAIARATDAALLPDDKARARRMTAELLLMQHTCHWYCRSRNVADARLLLRHQTPLAQVLQTIAPETAQAYRALVG